MTQPMINFFISLTTGVVIGFLISFNSYKIGITLGMLRGKKEAGTSFGAGFIKGEEAGYKQGYTHGKQSANTDNMLNLVRIRHLANSYQQDHPEFDAELFFKTVTDDTAEQSNESSGKTVS